MFRCVLTTPYPSFPLRAKHYTNSTHFIMITDPPTRRILRTWTRLRYDDFQKLKCRCDSHGMVSLSSLPLVFRHFLTHPSPTDVVLLASLLLIDTSYIPNQTHLLPSLHPHNPSFLHTRNSIHPLANNQPMYRGLPRPVHHHKRNPLHLPPRCLQF